MEERISGFKLRGTWEEIVEHGERITEALEDLGISSDGFDEWRHWRPKADEPLEAVNEKTATHASVDEGDGEAADESPTDDLHSAGEQLSASYENATGNDPDAAVEHGGDSLDYAARAADSAGRKLLRTVEETVYEGVMTRVSPYYFDNDLISANLRRSGTGLVSDDDEFVLEVDISDDDLKSDVADRLDEYETLDRWHGETRITTDTVEAAEGAELAD